jgi:hypothetical protein
MSGALLVNQASSAQSLVRKAVWSAPCILTQKTARDVNSVLQVHTSRTLEQHLAYKLTQEYTLQRKERIQLIVHQVRLA